MWGNTSSGVCIGVRDGSERKTGGIIVPTCVGKTTLAKLFSSVLREHNRACLVLDGDEVRDVFENKLGFDVKSRRKQTERIKRIVKLVAGGDVLPVVAVIHPFEEGRGKCRKQFPGYFEVAIDCGMKELLNRDNKRLYLPAIKGEKKNVVGVDIPFDPPVHADLILNSENLSPDNLLDILWEKFTSRSKISNAG